MFYLFVKCIESKREGNESIFRKHSNFTLTLSNFTLTLINIYLDFSFFLKCYKEGLMHII